MHLFIVVLLAARVAHGNPSAGASPAINFWKKALPDSSLPEALTAAVERGAHAAQMGMRQASLSGNCFGSYKKSGCGHLASIGFFFLEGALRVGNSMTISSPAAPEIAILPRKVADRMPFASSSTSSNLTDMVMDKFQISPGSAAASNVRNFLQKCLEPPVGNEEKACGTSLEGITEGAMRMLSTRQVWAFSSEIPRAGLPRHPYTIHAVRQLGDSGPSGYAACHNEPYPYGAYYCHTTGLKSTAYAISISPRMGGRPFRAAAICHQNTSAWSPTHPAFKVLPTLPGGMPVCHLLPYGDLLFGKKAART